MSQPSYTQIGHAGHILEAKTLEARLIDEVLRTLLTLAVNLGLYITLYCYMWCAGRLLKD